MWAPDAYLERLYQSAARTHAASYDEKWQKQLRQQFQAALGEFSFEQRELEPTVLEEKEFDEYVRQRVEFNSVEPLKIPAYVFLPKHGLGKKSPAVLALHGHGYGSKEISGLLPDGTENNGDPGIHQNFAVELARRGLVVVAPELIGFGDRRMTAEQDGKPAENSCFPIGSQLLLYGKTLAGLRVAESFRTIDFIKTLDAVDPSRIGCMGLSGGGLVAAFTSALDERIGATVICGYTNTFKGSVMARRHCIDNYIPGILQLAEMPELIGLITPRALFIESGTEDHLFPIDHVHMALDKLREIYQAFQAEDRLFVDIFPGEHEISGRKSMDWMTIALSML